MICGRGSSNVSGKRVFGNAPDRSLYGDATLLSRIETPSKCFGPVGTTEASSPDSVRDSSHWRKEAMNRKLLIPILVVARPHRARGVSLECCSATVLSTASGTVEARNIRVGSKIGGALIRSWSRGDPVEAGRF